MCFFSGQEQGYLFTKLLFYIEVKVWSNATRQEKEIRLIDLKVWSKAVLIHIVYIDHTKESTKNDIVRL